MTPALRLPRHLRVPPVVAACVLLMSAPALRAQEQATTLEPVVVTGKGFEQRVFDTPYSATVLDGATLRDAGPQVSLSESLARVPGLIAANRNNYAQDLQINSRGFGARSTFGVRGLRLYSDGIPATMPDGQGQVTHFDLAGAQRVEVLRGPFTALYGNSSGGVISLVSQPVRERYAELDADVGSFGLRQGRVTVQAPLGDTPGRGLDIRFGASYFEIDGFRPESGARRTLANLRVGYTGEQDTVVVSLNHLDQPADDPLGLTRAQFNQNPYQTTPQATSFDTRKTGTQDQIGANWRHRFADLGALSESAVTAYYGQRAVKAWQSIPPATQAAATSAGGVIDFDRDYQGLDGRLIWRWTLDGDRSAQFVAGAAYESSSENRRGYENFIGTGAAQQLGVTGRQRRDEVNEVRSGDAYAQAEYEFFKDWVATLGVRSGSVKFEAEDHYIVTGNGDDSGSLKYSYTNPVAALQWRASRELNVYVSGGRGFESPTFGELAYRPGGLPGFNSSLAAQTSRQVELGAKWRPAALGVSLDAAVFEARTKDEIGVASNVGGRSTFQNVGRTTRRGVELGAGWQVGREWRAAAALTWLAARYEDSPAAAPTIQAGNRIAGTTPRTAYAELAWRPNGESVEVAAEWRAQDRTPVNDANSDYAQGWATLALRGTQSFKLGNGSSIDVLARVDNVFDRVYAGSVIVNEGNGRFFEPASPRALLLSVKWRQAF